MPFPPFSTFAFYMLSPHGMRAFVLWHIPIFIVWKPSLNPFPFGIFFFSFVKGISTSFPSLRPYSHFVVFCINANKKKNNDKTRKCLLRKKLYNNKICWSQWRYFQLLLLLPNVFWYKFTHSTMKNKWRVCCDILYFVFEKTNY